MRKLILAMYQSLDGYIVGANGEFTAPKYSPDLKSKWIDRNLGRAGVMLYGRTAYEGMAQFWTSADAPKAEADILSAMEKIVFSTTLSRADWGNVRIVAADVPGEIARLKQQPGKDLIVLGGAGIANSLLAADLVDELDLLVSPLLQGGGKRLFADGRPRTALALRSAEAFDSGAVLMIYDRAESTAG